MKELVQKLWLASSNKSVCRIVLDGEPFPRIIHCYGVCQTSSGKVTLVCHQTAGYTKSGGDEGFRTLLFQKIKQVEILDQTFEVDPGFDPESPQYKDWVFHL